MQYPSESRWFEFIFRLILKLGQLCGILTFHEKKDSSKLIEKIKCVEERCTPSKAGELPPSVSTLQSVTKKNYNCKKYGVQINFENRQVDYLCWARPVDTKAQSKAPHTIFKPWSLKKYHQWKIFSSDPKNFSQRFKPDYLTLGSIPQECLRHARFFRVVFQCLPDIQRPSIYNFKGDK